MPLCSSRFMNSVNGNHGNQVFMVDRLIQCNAIQAGHILGHKVDGISCVGNHGTSGGIPATTPFNPSLVSVLHLKVPNSGKIF